MTIFKERSWLTPIILMIGYALLSEITCAILLWVLSLVYQMLTFKEQVIGEKALALGIAIAVSELGFLLGCISCVLLIAACQLYPRWKTKQLIFAVMWILIGGLILIYLQYI